MLLRLSFIFCGTLSDTRRSSERAAGVTHLQLPVYPRTVSELYVLTGFDSLE